MTQSGLRVTSLVQVFSPLYTSQDTSYAWQSAPSPSEGDTLVQSRAADVLLRSCLI